MIQVSPSATIYVVSTPISFAGRLKSTLGICRDLLHLEPMNGCYVVFRNRAGTMLRVIFYDGDGFWLCEKMFSKGSVRSWFAGEGLNQISARELSVLLWRGDFEKVQFPDFWKKMTA
jgi:transposase